MGELFLSARCPVNIQMIQQILLIRCQKALTEGVAMEAALSKALELTSADDTLILVTADHSHTFALAGYPDRTANIFNVLQVNTKDCLWVKSHN